MHRLKSKTYSSSMAQDPTSFMKFIATMAVSALINLLSSTTKLAPNALIALYYSHHVCWYYFLN